MAGIGVRGVVLAVGLGWASVASATTVSFNLGALGAPSNTIIGETAATATNVGDLVEFTFTVSSPTPVVLSFISGQENINPTADLWFADIGLTGSPYSLLGETIDNAGGSTGVQSSFNASYILASGGSYTFTLERYLVAGVSKSWSGTIELEECLRCAPPPGVPLPAAFPLFAAAVGGGGFLGWRRRKRKS